MPAPPGRRGVRGPRGRSWALAGRSAGMHACHGQSSPAVSSGFEAFAFRTDRTEFHWQRVDDHIQEQGCVKAHVTEICVTSRGSSMVQVTARLPDALGAGPKLFAKRSSTTSTTLRILAVGGGGHRPALRHPSRRFSTYGWAITASARVSSCSSGRAWMRAVVASLRGPQRRLSWRRVTFASPCASPF